MKRVVRITLLVPMAGVMGLAAVKAPSSVAYRDTCHSTTVALPRTWRVSGATVSMGESPYPLTWKAPARTGKYKLRVKAEYAGEGSPEITYSAVKTVRVD